MCSCANRVSRLVAVVKRGHRSPVGRQKGPAPEERERAFQKSQTIVLAYNPRRGLHLEYDEARVGSRVPIQDEEFRQAV